VLGVILLVVDVILLMVGSVGRKVGGRRRYWSCPRMGLPASRPDRKRRWRFAALSSAGSVCGWSTLLSMRM
jgi:hypothetical protein